MPLTPYQEEIARLLSSNRSFDSCLAGGAAIHLEPNTTRYSNDLDDFHDSTERLSEARDADGAASCRGCSMDRRSHGAAASSP